MPTKRRPNKSKNIEDIKKEYEDMGLTLLEDEYKGIKEKMNCICLIHKNKGILKISLRSIRDKKGCRFCGIQKRADKKRHSFEFIKEQFENRGYILLENEFITAITKMRFICPKHPEKTQKLTYNKLQQGRGCKDCGYEIRATSQRYTYEFVFQKFNEKQYKLLSDKYTNIKDLLSFICLKHEEQGVQETNFYSIIHSDKSCKYCIKENKSKENSHNWKGGISSLSDFIRDSIEPWKRASFEKCKYKCEITGSNQRLEIHHPLNFSSILSESLRELNMQVLDDINKYKIEELWELQDKCLEMHFKHGLGICLTKDIHREFHQIYGYQNNTLEQFEEFKQNKLKEIEMLGEVS